MLKDLLCLVFSLFLMVSFTSCASIMHGRKQDINVNSDPQGAVVTVDNISITTPAIITLDRRKFIYVLRLEKDGYEPVERYKTVYITISPT